MVHDFEHFLSLRQKAVLVTPDVQGAFDALLHERLLQRVKRNGCPKYARDWIQSFLKSRKARVRYKYGATEPKTLECGISQESPLFPILSLLYMLELLAGSSVRFRYGNEIALLDAGKTTEEAEAIAQQEVNNIIKWARDNTVSFEIKMSKSYTF